MPITSSILLLVRLLSNGGEARALLGAMKALKVIVSEDLTARPLIQRRLVFSHAPREVLNEWETSTRRAVDSESTRHTSELLMF
jgi:hypothetical protein